MRSLLQRAAFLAWIPGVSLLVASTMVEHWVVLPTPSRASLEALELLHEPGTDSELLAVHFLYADCPCSRRVLEHLVRSERPAHTRETVVLVGEDPSFVRRARARGFAVESVRADELESKYGVEAVPLLVLADPTGTVRYVGGYTDRKQGLAVRDVELMAALRDGTTTPVGLPLYGCGVATALQGALDPMGLKY